MTPQSDQTEDFNQQLEQLRQEARQRAEIDAALNRLFAPEDDALQFALAAEHDAEMPAIQISPIQGRLLQVLAIACGARKILEIGALAGYSGIWLARALPSGGRLISLEVSEKHAAVARASLERAGLSDRAEVRLGSALEILPTLTSEAPFDLVFIDADKPPYPSYLDWALKLTRPGSIIVADNCIRGGKPLREPVEDDPTTRGLSEYDHRVATDSQLVSVAFPMDDGGMDGFAISVVRTVVSEGNS
ncbi:MAG TPA: O-methyltransferase [Ktedonobacterales bacterium]|nr:O-methyltransferase [Ktedonobacterales bacterium]